MVLVDENQKIVSWNGTAADLFGVPAAQALGQLAADVAGQPRTVTGLGREDFAQVIAKRGWWSGSLLYQRRDGSEFLLQATGVRVPLERGAGTLWLSHLPGKDSDQQALGEALALADVERRRLTMIAEAGKLNHGLERSKRKRRRRAARQHNYAASARPPLPDHRKGPSRQRPAPRRRREGTQFSYPTAAPRSGA